MKITGKINILTPTESGISQASGNPWKRKEVVVEYSEKNEAGEDRTHTIAFSTLNDSIVEELEKCSIGDTVEFNYVTKANGRNFTRKDGTQGFIRNTEIICTSLKNL